MCVSRLKTVELLTFSNDCHSFEEKKRNLLYTSSTVNLYINRVLGGSVRLSVCLFVHYRNHLPVVQFQN